MPAAGAKYVPVGRLYQSRSPIAELGAAAQQAQAAAGIGAADFIVVAVEPGQADAVVAAVEAAARGETSPGGGTQRP